MTELLQRLFSADGFMPHGHCYLWSPNLVRLHVFSDALITLAYYSIPISLAWFVRRRRDVDFRWMFVCFAIFILACGTTHLLEIWNIWHADYWLSGAIKAITAAASVPTAILLTRLLPQALALPSPEALRQANRQLEEEVVTRREVERKLRELVEQSELHVAERTASLEQANSELRRVISERENAEAAVRESSERLQTVIENLREGLVLCDLDGQILLWNRSAIQIHDLDDEEDWLLKLPEFGSIYELSTLEGDKLELDQWPMARVLRGEAVDNIEVRIHRIGTSWQRLFNYGGAVVVEPSGKKVAFVTITDITQRKQNEETLRQQAALFRQTYDAIFVWDLHGPITFWNAGAERLYGFTAAEALGATSHRLLGTQVAGGLETFLATIQDADGWEGELEQTARDGRKIVVESRMKVVRDGQRTQVMEANRDITERKHTEDEIRRLNTDLEQRVKERTAQLEVANKELEAFSYSVSHDLRSPLRAVDGFAQALSDDYGTLLPPDGQRFLRTIRQGAQRMGLLIDDLLSFSRLSRLPLTRRTVAMREQAQETLEELAAFEAAPKVETQIDDLPDCQGDPALLKHVWMNLISNALKYSRKREVARIHIGYLQEGAHTVYFVKDNGTGFDMRYVGKLFGVFQRLHRQDEFEGTGVGLAIVQRIVNRHGGRVWAEASPDQGATFYFQIDGNSPL